MTTIELDQKLIIPFEGCKHVINESGYIVWRVGSGSSIELLHIEAYDRRKGIGRNLVHAMLLHILSQVTIFGFTRAENEEAIHFYAKLGFQLTTIPHFYGSQRDAVLFSQQAGFIKA